MALNQDHLTQPNEALGARIKATPDGMAFWAGSGPESKTCRECVFWQGGDRSSEDGSLNDARCAKYIRMMRAALLIENVAIHEIPQNTAACKYFDTHPHPPRNIKVSGADDEWRYVTDSGEKSKPYKSALAAALAGAREAGGASP